MYHTIYKVTNLLNNKIYIGKHSSEIIEDCYMGSGKLIRRSIKKYGIENFKKEILYVLESELSAYEKEKEVVNEEFVLRKDTYNLISGGDCFESINSNIEFRKNKNKKAAISMNKIIWLDEEFRKRNKDRVIEQNKKMWNDEIFRNKMLSIIYNAFSGKTHTEETKRKIGEKSSINQKGEKNSQYGTCWIYKEQIGNKKIKINELENYLKDDWIKGRKLK